jgi:hypothetical protein
MTKYDPKRWTKEWKEHMNSPEVVEEHRKLVVRIRDYKDKKREQMDERARD